jgi:hypothetical protein
MDIQLTIYPMLSLPLYNSFQTFLFINIFLFTKHVFMLKSQVASNKLKPNPTNMMCSLIINKYNNCPSQYESLSLTKFSSFYNKEKDIKTSQTSNY